MTYKRSLTTAALAALCSLGIAHAASNDAPALAGASMDQQGAMDSHAVGADFGTGVNILQIPAAEFTQRNPTATLTYGGNGYLYQSAGLVDSTWAPVFLPQGAGIQWLDLYSRDTNAADNISATIRMWTGYSESVPPTFSDLVTVDSFGSAGYQYTAALVSPIHTVNNNVRYNGGAQYTIVITTPVNDSSLQWKAVDIWWYRQIAPAPASASFTDVPTSAQFFREVEALAQSGITSGCNATQFCPEQPVTRRQMAAFLSRALGLGFAP